MEKKHNPDAFKHSINKTVLINLAKAIHKVYPAFKQQEFIAIANQLTKLELKPRVRRIRDQLYHQLPKDYSAALKILMTSLKEKNLSGFDLWPYTEFVQTYGQNHLEISLQALYKLTSLFTAEFAVRPFLINHPKQTIQFLVDCSLDKDVHIRRWASEGSRSRLPWGERLQAFVKDHKPTLPVLENLKHDAELYVRKSVANHLNDMAKDHPLQVIQILKRWQTEAMEHQQKNMNWIIHHALRTLIKKGDPKALQLIGAQQNIKIKVGPLKLTKSSLKLEQRLDFTFTITSTSTKSQKLVVDYIIHFMKANKSTKPKVFKLKTIQIKPLEKLALFKSHHLKKVTTRTYYPGLQYLEIQINGKSYAKVKWNLKS